jgi:RNA methyltransferase, TrmH family
MDTITSLQNPIVKLLRSLDRKKERQETGLFLAEGAKVLERARTLGWQPKYLVTRAGVELSGWTDWAKSSGARHLPVSDSLMRSLSPQGNPPDIIAAFPQKWTEPPVKPHGPEPWLALEDVRDPGNLGTIIRTADAINAQGVMLLGQSCDPYSKECVRATMGSIFKVPLPKLGVQDFAGLARSWPGDVIGTHLAAPDDFRRTYRSPTLLLLGSEGSGLSPELAKLCTLLVRIPMPGATESLNIGAAAALMLYEIRRNDLG